MSFLHDFVTENVIATCGSVAPDYADLLRHCYAEPPPFAQRFFGSRYRELAANAEWFANSLVANSALEGYGSTQIWKFSNRLTDSRHRAAVRQHSLDESRHSTMFVRMLDLTFPGIEILPGARHQIDLQQPRYTRTRHPSVEAAPLEERHDELEALTELVKVHITEIRALILQHLLRPVLLAYAPSDNRRVLRQASDVLIRDEARHISYSAEFFVESMQQGHRDFMFWTFESEARKFDDLTLAELELETIEL